MAEAKLDRRAFLAGATASALVPRRGAAETPTPFDFDALAERAQARARADFAERRQTLSGPFADLDYDSYRSIRYRADRRLWEQENRGFTVDLLPPGSIYADAVSISTVVDGIVEPFPFDATAFDFDPNRFELPQGRARAEDGAGLAWTGFRLRFPINRADVKDELMVFQGASYFRAIGRDQVFGLSARALAIGTGEPRGEEFPVFTDFWLHRPEEDATEMTVHALLDSVSTTGAFEFVVRPGAETVTDVRAVLFPRTRISDVGIAPLTSMHLFSPLDRRGVDDYRNAVHDSAGLQMLSGAGERIWRPLVNPTMLEVSTFVDQNPAGFGLAQRNRSFSDFSDAEARYGKRPTAWVAPKGNWGPGGVTLVEIPTQTEFNDNIVAFWRPESALEAGQAYPFDYRLYWGETPPDEVPLARAIASRGGRYVNDPSRRAIIVDFALGELALDGLTLHAEAGSGEIESAVLSRLPGEGMVRAALRFAPPAEGGAELRLVLRDSGGAPASETWLYRWGTN